MKPFKIILMALALSLSPSLFAETLDELILRAESVRQQAAKSGFEWTGTQALIKKAENAAAKGDKKLALKLAKKALTQGQNSLAQAEYSEKHWQEHQIQ